MSSPYCCFGFSSGRNGFRCVAARWFLTARGSNYFNQGMATMNDEEHHFGCCSMLPFFIKMDMPCLMFSYRLFVDHQQPTHTPKALKGRNHRAPYEVRGQESIGDIRALKGRNQFHTDQTNCCAPSGHCLNLGVDNARVSHGPKLLSPFRAIAHNIPSWVCRGCCFPQCRIIYNKKAPIVIGTF